MFILHFDINIKTYIYLQQKCSNWNGWKDTQKEERSNKQEEKKKKKKKKGGRPAADE